MVFQNLAVGASTLTALQLTFFIDIFLKHILKLLIGLCIRLNLQDHIWCGTR